MSVPAGWYPDPDPDAAPGGSRYWDGQAWTSQVRTEAVAAPGQPAYDPYRQPGEGAHPYVAAPVHPGYAEAGKPTRTPDGQQLAGYGRRVGAYLLDTIILAVLGLALSWSYLNELVDAFARFFEATVAAAEAGGAPPDQQQLIADTSGPLLMVSLITLALSFVYFCGFWRWLSATPGKLALGLRIRRWDRSGPLGWGQVLPRWLGLNLGSLVSVVPILGFLGFFWPFADLLWPLWDQRRQALHDKFAGTVVVRR